MIRSVAWVLIVGIMTAFLAMSGFLEPTIREEGRVVEVFQRTITLVDRAGKQNPRTIGAAVKISLNDRDVEFDELDNGDEVALLSDVNGDVRQILAARGLKDSRVPRIDVFNH